MKKLLIAGTAIATVTSVAVVTAATTTAAAALPTSHVHLLLTRAELQAKDPATGCWLTASPACAPDPLLYNFAPFSSGQPPVVEQAGSTNYLILWEPPGFSVVSDYNALLQQFLGDVGGSSLYGIATQYYQTVGGVTQHIVNNATVGGVVVDTDPFPSNPMSDEQVQAELQKVRTANNWPAGVGNEYFVYLADGEGECLSPGTCFDPNGTNTTFCAYHGYLPGSPNVLYAVMPYDGDKNLAACGIQSQDLIGGTPPTPNNPDVDSEISTTSHELMETVTDPLLSAWYDATGFEIGDKCAYTYGPETPNGADIVINGHPYVVQEEFSNAEVTNGGCDLS